MIPHYYVGIANLPMIVQAPHRIFGETKDTWTFNEDSIRFPETIGPILQWRAALLSAAPPSMISQSSLVCPLS